MPRAYIGVGSNIDPEPNIRAAVDLLSNDVEVVAISTFYRTAPVGRADLPDFYNGIIAVETELNPRELKFDVLRKIEMSLGRARTADPNAARTIDLDIELYANTAVSEPDLVIPDPDILRRPFLALPLLELAPEIVLPGLGKLADLVRGMSADEMAPLDEFTAELKGEHRLV